MFGGVTAALGGRWAAPIPPVAVAAIVIPVAVITTTAARIITITVAIPGVATVAVPTVIVTTRTAVSHVFPRCGGMRAISDGIVNTNAAAIQFLFECKTIRNHSKVN
jgi:hypothetical protein